MISIQDVQDILSDEKNNPHGYYNVYKKYETAYWEFIPRWILRYAKTKEVKNVLDIGIAYGTLGLFAKLNTGCNLYGIDFMRYMSDELIQKYDIKYLPKNIETDEFKFDAKFDICIFTEALEHMNFSVIPTLLKIKNLMTDDGLLFLTTPDAESGWGKLRRYKTYNDMPKIGDKITIEDTHIYQFNLSELKEIFNTVGLNIDKVYYSESSKNMKHFNFQLSKIKE